MQDELYSMTIDLNSNGLFITELKDKKVIRTRHEPIIIFKMECRKKKGKKDSDEIYILMRYKKRSGTYVKASKFIITSPQQATQVVDILKRWIG